MAKPKETRTAVTMPHEIRYLTHAELRISEPSGDQLDDGHTIEGYAATYNTPTVIAGEFIELITPGAFARSLRENVDCRCLRNHQPNDILGRTKAGTLILREDAKGLFFRCSLPDTGTGRDLYTSIKRGDIDGCSFAFIVEDQEWDEIKGADGQWMPRRQLKDVTLMDVSAVTYPQYPGTSLLARTTEVPAEIRSKVIELNEKPMAPPVVEEKATPINPGVVVVEPPTPVEGAPPAPVVSVITETRNAMDDELDDMDDEDMYDWDEGDLVYPGDSAEMKAAKAAYAAAKSAAKADLKNAYSTAGDIKDGGKDAAKAVKAAAKAAFGIAKTAAQTALKQAMLSANEVGGGAPREEKSAPVVEATVVVPVIDPGITAEIKMNTTKLLTEADREEMFTDFLRRGPFQN